MASILIQFPYISLISLQTIPALTDTTDNTTQYTIESPVCTPPLSHLSLIGQDFHGEPPVQPIKEKESGTQKPKEWATGSPFPKWRDTIKSRWMTTIRGIKNRCCSGIGTILLDPTIGASLLPPSCSIKVLPLNWGSHLFRQLEWVVLH